MVQLQTKDPPNMSYLEAARGSTIADIKDNKDFQTDLVRFLSSSRKNYSINELKELGVDGMVDEYVEHMRSQDVNEATAAMDLYFAKDTNDVDFVHISNVTDSVVQGWITSHFSSRELELNALLSHLDGITWSTEDDIDLDSPYG